MELKIAIKYRKLPKFNVAKLENGQNSRLPSLLRFSVLLGSIILTNWIESCQILIIYHQYWKLPRLEIVEIEICKNSLVGELLSFKISTAGSAKHKENLFG